MKTEQLNATLVEIGDDEDGQPRLIFTTTREEISRMKTCPLYLPAMLTIETEESDE